MPINGGPSVFALSLTLQVPVPKWLSMREIVVVIRYFFNHVTIVIAITATMVIVMTTAAITVVIVIVTGSADRVIIITSRAATHEIVMQLNHVRWLEPYGYLHVLILC